MEHQNHPSQEEDIPVEDVLYVQKQDRTPATDQMKKPSAPQAQDDLLRSMREGMQSAQAKKDETVLKQDKPNNSTEKMEQTLFHTIGPLHETETERSINEIHFPLPEQNTSSHGESMTQPEKTENSSDEISFDTLLAQAQKENPPKQDPMKIPAEMPLMRTKKQNHKKTLARILALVTALLLLSVGTVIGIKLYQQKDQKASATAFSTTTVEELYARYYTSGNYLPLCEDAVYPISEMEKPENVSAYVKEYLDGKKITYQQLSSEKNEECYEVLADEVVFSAFTVTKADKQVVLKSMTLTLPQSQSVKIRVNHLLLPMINGYVLNQSYVTQTMRAPLCDHLPPSMNVNLQYDIYEYFGLYAAPDIQVSDGKGNLYPVTYSAENGIYVYDDLPNDLTLSKTYTDTVLGVAKAFRRFEHYDEKYQNLIGSILPTSTWYDYVRRKKDFITDAHVSDDFRDASVTAFYAYDEYTFSCRVRFTHVFFDAAGNEMYTEAIDQIWIFVNPGDGIFRMYDKYDNE